MPDWTYEVVEELGSFMEGVTLFDVLVLGVSGSVLPLLFVLVHELGHLVAAVTLRDRVAELVVGDEDPVLAVRAGGFQLRLGTIAGSGDTAGYVLYDGTRATPRNALVIALAGPAASLGGAVLTAVAIPRLVEPRGCVGPRERARLSWYDPNEATSVPPPGR